MNNGGPAFPCMPPQDIGTGSAVSYPYPDQGMNLRDYLAVHADIGNVDELSLTAGVRLLGTDCPGMLESPSACFAWWADYRAKLRYIEADAMLKARK